MAPIDIALAVCVGCGKELDAPAAVIKLADDYHPVCSVPCIETAVKAELERIACVFCTFPTPPDDRLPVPTGEGRFCHAACGLDATLKLGFRRVSMLLRRSGPAFEGS